MIVYNSVYSIFSVSHRAESQKWVILLVPDVPNIAMCCTFFSLEFYATKVSGGGLESRAVHDCGRRRRRRSRRRWRRSRRRRQQQSATAPSRATDLAHLQPA